MYFANTVWLVCVPVDKTVKWENVIFEAFDVTCDKEQLFYPIRKCGRGKVIGLYICLLLLLSA